MNKATATELHRKYCRKLASFARNWGHGSLDIGQPDIEFKVSGTKVGGKYSSAKHCCIYMLDYMAVVDDEYEETIAHEVCHAYQQMILPSSKWHGDFFLFLLRNVCGFKEAGIRHTHPVGKIKVVAEYLKLQQKMS